MFTVEERDRVRARLIELAKADDRIVAAAEVGSLALGGGDRWSDLDLTFGVADGAAVADVLEDWTATVAAEFDAVMLLDLVVRATTYRVFLLPELLQVDLSFASIADFRQGGPRFRLIFGTHKVDFSPPPEAENLFGWAVVYARHAYVTIERGKLWEAEHMITSLRHTALTLACLRRALPTAYAKGFEQLPPAVLARGEDALVGRLEPGDLRRSLAAAIAALLGEAEAAPELAAKVEPQLRALAA